MVHDIKNCDYFYFWKIKDNQYFSDIYLSKQNLISNVFKN